VCVTHSRGIHIGHHQENPGMLCITDPHLGSIDYVIVLVFFSAGLQSKCVAARLGFREAEASNLSQQITIMKAAQHTQCNTSKVYGILCMLDSVFIFEKNVGIM